MCVRVFVCVCVCVCVSALLNPFSYYYNNDGPGAVANRAERQKMDKYKDITATHLFVPIGIETTGVLGSEARNFLHELAQRLKAETGEQRSHHYLLQRIAVAVQRGNAASVLGSSNDFQDDFIIF